MSTYDTRPEADLRARPIDRHGRYEVRGLLGAGGMGIVLEGFDPDLERPVAIKVLHPDLATGDATDRLIREARAMARLAHPNVVPVYEVGWSKEHVFLAMELIEGMTLRRWLEVRARSWRDIVAIYVAAGRGLAAAHRAGMVHRDFKPENVLIGVDGRPRVTDFGLVADAPLATPEPELSRSTVAGTPAYMSPEQWRSDAVGPASDQFAFCVALWEALHGARPFGGSQTAALRTAVCRGEVAPPRREVPRWLDAALRRGLAIDPAARWPILSDLLDVLERRSHRSRRWLAAAAALVAALASAGAVLAIERTPAIDPCPRPDARIAAVWGPARSALIGARLGGRQAATTRQVDAHLDRWRTMHGEACRATHVRGEQSGELLDARMRCLDHRLREVDETLQLVAVAADPEQLDHATGALFQLTPIADCGHADVAHPVPPGRRTELDALAQRIQRARIDYRAGRFDGLVVRVEAAVAEARDIGHTPTHATALALLADVQLEVGAYIAAEQSLRALIQIAATAHDDRTEARAWNQLIYAIGYARGEAATGLALEPAAMAALARAGDPLDVRVEQVISIAQILDAGPRVGEAITRLTEAKQRLDAAIPRDGSAQLVELRLDVLAELGNAYNVAGDHGAEIASLNEALAGYRALFGPDTLDEAMVLTNLGDALRRVGKQADALVALGEAARITEAKTGESQRLALVVQQIAYALGEQDRWPAALASFERALAIARRWIPAGDATLAPYVAGHASALAHTDRAGEARQQYDAAIALFAEDDVNLPIALFNRGELDFAQRRYADAVHAYTRAVTLFEKLRGPAASYLLYPLVGLGRVHVRGGQAGTARRVLERAVAIEPDGGDRVMAAAARAWLGRALLASARTRGLQLIREGRAALTALAASDSAARHELKLLEGAR